MMDDRLTDKQFDALSKKIAERFAATQPLPTRPTSSVPAVPRSGGVLRLERGRVVHGGGTLPLASADEKRDEDEDYCGVPLILLIGCALLSVCSMIVSIGTAFVVVLS